MKIFAVFALVLATGLLVPCQADTAPTQTFNVVAMCDPNLNPFSPVCSVPAEINAVFTTQMETGTFFDPADASFFDGTEPVVTNITGTFDGLPMTLVPEPLPFAPWLSPPVPANISFVAGGIGYTVEQQEGDVFLILGGTLVETLDWSAIETVPESPLFWMLLIGLLLVGLSRWAQMSLRKLSSRQ